MSTLKKKSHLLLDLTLALQTEPDDRRGKEGGEWRFNLCCAAVLMFQLWTTAGLGPGFCFGNNFIAFEAFA